jgi:hypothetical protein
MKLCVLITAHCPPAVIELTIGSFIRSLSPGYELDIHLGLHSNYSDYTKDLSIFDDMKGIASIHLVDEIDWMGPEYNACIYRYSTMHAKNLVNLVKHVKHTEFDYLVILDQDLFFRTDVISESIAKFPKAQLIGSLFEDKDRPWSSTTILDSRNILIMPKMSIWHLILSRDGFETMLPRLDEVSPIEVFHPPTVTDMLSPYGIIPNTSIFYDTFARIFHYMKFNDKEIGILKSDQFKNGVEHFYRSSFNYGQRNLGVDGYVEHIEKINTIYRSEFPRGLTDLKRLIQT